MFVALFLTSLYNARNCRFLIDPVPREQIDWTMRRHCKDFCEAVAKKQEYRVPREEHEDWMPTGRAGDELFCFQVNARKDGHLLLERCCFHVFWGRRGGVAPKSLVLEALQFWPKENMPSLQYLGKCPHDISRTLAELRSTKEVFSTTFSTWRSLT